MMSISLCAGPAAALATWSWPTADVLVTAPPPRASAAPRVVPVPVRAEDGSVHRDEPIDACLRQAQAALRQREFEAALGWFDHAVALEPGLPLAHVGRAISLLELGRDGDAGDALGNAYESTRAAPGETDLLLARVYALGGERAAALRQLGDALQAAPLLAELARGDPAFRSMRDHPHFLQVLGDL